MLNRRKLRHSPHLKMAIFRNIKTSEDFLQKSIDLKMLSKLRRPIVLIWTIGTEPLQNTAWQDAHGFVNVTVQKLNALLWTMLEEQHFDELLLSFSSHLYHIS